MPRMKKLGLQANPVRSSSWDGWEDWADSEILPMVPQILEKTPDTVVPQAVFWLFKILESVTAESGVSLAFEQDPLAFGNECKKLGRFMLATNDLSLGDGEILQAYKEQQNVERGFRFLKNGDFQLTPVFLKKPSRIQALSFVMCFSLMVYAVIENRLRTSLAEANETIHIQDTGPAEYKDNAKPTLMKVFALFDHLGSTTVAMPGGVEMLIRSSLPPEVCKVLHHLGSPYEKAFEGSM